jgi:DNA-binding CsgD family transcriptional regulator
MAKQPGDDACAPLTRRLADLLELRGHGWSYNEIGAEHGLQGDTVRAYLRQARLLLGAGTADEAIQEASRRGIIELGGQGQLHPRPRGPRWITGN